LELLREYNLIRPKSSYFFTTLKAGNKENKISVRYPQKMVKKYSERAGINNKNISPHTLRHTFATGFYRQTKDMGTLRKILDHSNSTTQTVYTILMNDDVSFNFK